MCCYKRYQIATADWRCIRAIPMLGSQPDSIRVMIKLSSWSHRLAGTTEEVVVKQSKSVVSLTEAQDVYVSDKRRSNNEPMLKPMPNTTRQPNKTQFIHIQDRDWPTVRTKQRSTSTNNNAKESHKHPTTTLLVQKLVTNNRKTYEPILTKNHWHYTDDQKSQNWLE